MKRIHFDAGNFFKFLNDDETSSLGWTRSFELHGFKTYRYDFDNDPRHSLSEEEYTWFILRFS